jgi:integrase
MTWPEQQAIESQAPVYLRNVIRILTETGLRVYKELAPLRKEQVDLSNKLVFIADSKTLTGVAEVPLTDIAAGWKSLVQGRGSFQVRKAQPGIRRTSRRPGSELCGSLVYPTSGCTISGPHTLLVSVRVALRTNGSRSSFGRLMREYSRSTPDQAANEEGGAGQAEPPSRREGVRLVLIHCFGDRAGFDTVLIGFGE